MLTPAIVIHTTCATSEEAEKIANALLSQKLAACIQQSNIKSQYIWEGKLETSDEIKLEIKTTANMFDQVSAAILQLSRYDCPEIVATPIVNGDTAYLNWLASSVQN